TDCRKSSPWPPTGRSAASISASSPRPDRSSAGAARADQGRGAEQSNDLVGDLLWRPSHIDGQGIFIGRRLLERVDLALQKAGRHEMAVASRQMLGDDVASAAQIDEP